MCGGIGGKIGGRGTGGDNSYNRQVHTSIDHGRCRHPMVTMGSSLAWQPLCQIGCYAVLFGKGHRGGMMCGGVGGKNRRKRNRR
jgi:hypothetical protein